MPPPLHSFPNAIAHYRTLVGLSQRTLADRLGIGQPTLSALESGTSLPAWSLACSIAEALGISADLLYEDDIVDRIRRADA